MAGGGWRRTGSAGDAVADRQLGDVADGLVADRSEATRHVGEHVGPALLAGRRGRLGDITDERHRAGRAAPADDPQGDGGVVLGLVDDDVPVDEGRAVEDRVGLVDEELVGGRPGPATAAGPGQQPVDELDRLLGRRRRVERLAQRAGLRPGVVAIGPTAQLLLGDGPQPLATLVERDHAVGGSVEPLGDLVAGEHDAAGADRHDDVGGAAG